MPIRNELLLADMDVLVCGLAFTGRTETVEDYFKTRVKSLVSIGISSCFLKENLSFCRVYEQGKLVNEVSVPNLRLKEYQWYRQPLMPFVVLMYFWAISLALRKVKKKYGLCIGISHSFGLWGVILKKVGVVRQCVYYCLDYYIPYSGAGFHGLFIKLLNAMDRFNVRKSDYVWDVSEKVSEYRQIYGNLKKDSYKKIIVPMGYSRSLRVLNDFDAGSRWNIGFVGSITANQGLQLLVEAMPDILKELPRVRVKIIGQGPFSEELKSLVKNRNLGEYFEFLG
ncbi:MAG: glycosyltransferase, partial [Candidatus Omnitrophota bacterium]